MNSLKIDTTPLGAQSISPKSLPWVLQEWDKVKGSFLPSILDINWLCNLPALPFLIPMIPPYVLYLSMQQHGFEHCLEIIEWIRGAQLQKILDFDLWEKSHQFEEWDMDPEKLVGWIRLWLEVGAEFAAERFLELEEETMILATSKLFEVIPNGLENATDEVKENWAQTPDKKYFIRFRQEIPEYEEILTLFLQALYGFNLKIASSLFAYSAMLVRQEVLEEGLKWRQNRLADQGFVSYEEAKKFLAAKDLVFFKKHIWQNHTQKNHSKTNNDTSNEAWQKPISLLEDADTIEDMANYLKTFQPEEGVRYLQLILEESQLKELAGNSDTPLEHFYDEDEFLEDCAKNISRSISSFLVQLEKVKETYHQTQGHNGILIDQVFSLLRDLQEYSQIQQKVLHIVNHVVSAKKDSFDANSLLRASLITRGFINIGCEFCLRNPNEIGVCFETETDLEKAKELILLHGVEFMFQLGWHLVLSLQQECLKDLSKIKKEKLTQKSFTKWLEQHSTEFSDEVSVVLQALSHEIPMYPKVLEQQQKGRKITQEIKEFETMEQVSQCEHFISNMSWNLQ